MNVRADSGHVEPFHGVMAATSAAMTVGGDSISSERALRSQKRREMRYQRHVGGRHIVIAQTVWSDPGEFLSFFRGHNALPAPAHIERHQKMKVGVFMAREGEWGDARLCDRNSQFLLKLADERL